MSLLNNRYLILSELGKGGFGHTFLAEDTHLPSHRHCVIKQFKPANNDPELLPHLQERFGREASILEKVGEEHSQIPRLYAYFIEDEQFYLVQELIDGQTLGQMVRTAGPLRSGVVRDIVSSLLDILEYLHANDIIHRDIKPDNIIYRKRDSKPVLIDFGTVKETVTTVYDRGGVPTSLIIGSPGYMPMEQAAGLAVYSSDLYALGWTAIYLLTGKQPAELVDRRTGANHWREFAPEVEYDLAAAIDKAVQRVSSDRYVTAGEMLHVLHPVLPETVPSPMPVLPQSLPPQQFPSAPVSPEPVPSPPIPQNPVPLVQRFVEREYLLEPADRWRIPLLYSLLYVPLCGGSVVLSHSILKQILLWSVCGIAQALLLRKYINPLAWTGVATIGAAIAQVVSITWGYDTPYDNYYAVYDFNYLAYNFRLIMLILIWGIGQWLVLLKYVKAAQKWLLASIVAAIGISIVYYAEVKDGKLPFTAPLINWPLAGLILGTAQASLLRSFRKRKAAAEYAD